MDIRNISIIGVTLLLSIAANIGHAQGVLSCVEMRTLYRGYSNVIQVGTGAYKKEVSLLSNELDFSKKDSSSYYARVKGTGREATIYVVSENAGDTLLISKYRIRNLPPPTLFLGDKIDGEIIDTNNLIISCGYGKTTIGPTTTHFEIETYELIIPNEAYVYTGVGNTLSMDAAKKIKSLIGNSQKREITLYCKVRGSDGILRKKTATFKLE